MRHYRGAQKQRLGDKHIPGWIIFFSFVFFSSALATKERRTCETLLRRPNPPSTIFLSGFSQTGRIFTHSRTTPPVCSPYRTFAFSQVTDAVDLTRQSAASGHIAHRTSPLLWHITPNQIRARRQPMDKLFPTRTFKQPEPSMGLSITPSYRSPARHIQAAAAAAKSSTSPATAAGNTASLRGPKAHRRWHRLPVISTRGGFPSRTLLLFPLISFLCFSLGSASVPRASHKARICTHGENNRA
jgi:hypothetical protein